VKIAYILPINTGKYDGVLNKVCSQVEAWQVLNVQTIVFLIIKEKNSDLQNSSLSPLVDKNLVKVYKEQSFNIVSFDLLKDWFGLLSVYNKVLNEVENFKPDVVYTRNTLYQPFYKRLGEKFNLVLEINTDIKSEYKLQAFQSLKYFFRYVYFLFTNKKYLKNVSGIASVTDELSKLYKQSQVGIFANSINVDAYQTFYNMPLPKHKLLFLGSPDMPWQGVDILLLLANKMSYVEFYIVGYDKEDFKNIPNNVTFCGFLNKTKYLKLIQQATALIGTMALFRKNMEEACPLKVREYLACCKPVILPYKDTAFEQKGYPEWVLKLPNSKEGILNSSQEIKNFLNKCYGFNITKEDVKPYVHVDVIEKERIDFLYSVARI
tara:strand:+ start:6505 stop:7638 length:1134 start_codon:yes stop_codon:yes gene_type:complete